MKKIILALAIFTTISSYGQDLIDSNGDKVAEVNAAGILLNGEGEALGEFLTNGDIKDAEGNVIGSFSGGEFKDPAGTVLGTLAANNDVFDLNGSKIGSVQAGLIVIDANNHVVGRASAVTEPSYLAAYFFFFFNIGLM